MTTWQIIESEFIEWLRSYSGPRYHAVLSDPPYALISITKRFGKDGSAPAQEGSDGRFTRLSGGFMGQKWDGFTTLEHYQDWVSQWAELLIEKALYPGAVCLFFGGTRTFHHLGIGLERGGFEIVDCLMWLHGQGFPKSHDISKGLDKAAGAERETTGVNPNFRSGPTSGHRSYHEDWDDKRWTMNPNVTKPATSEAEEWEGYGTALKPAWEPIFLCRAPRGDKTFAQLATEFGTGALNIDGSRIAGTKGAGVWGTSNEGIDTSRKFNASPGMLDYRSERHDSGRWPANFILSHDEDCVKVGEFEVEGRKLNRYPSHGAGGSFAFYAEDHKGEEYESEEMPPETVERWACVPSCPVRMLDDQAGELSSGLMKASTTRAPRPEHAVYSGVWEGNATNQDTYADVGGPSRFFYTAKASRSEKDKGLEDFYWERTDKGFQQISLNEYEQLDKRERAHGCIHPTVKPLAILRYLSALSLPQKQGGEIRRILIPFSGSGSEMIGAVQASWDEVTGIEMEQNYIEMAEARLRANIGMF